MRDEVLSLSPSYLKTVIIVEGRKSPLLRDARNFFSLIKRTGQLPGRFLPCNLLCALGIVIDKSRAPEGRVVGLLN